MLLYTIEIQLLIMCPLSALLDKLIFQSYLQELAILLHKAAREAGYVDPDNIEDILRFSGEGLPLGDTDTIRKGRVSAEQILQLSESMMPTDMEFIAKTYLNLSEETIEYLQPDNKDHSFEFIPDLLHNWAFRTRGFDQLQVSQMFTLSE